jgi:dienelactone hydrolase
MSTRVEHVRVPDGTFDLTVWLPGAGHGPAILLIQEIYGVSEYIRAVAGDLAALGYVVGAPDMFWRIQPGYAAAHDEAGLKESMALASRYDGRAGLDDAEAAYRHLAALPEVSDGAGIIGFCFGGTVAFELAARVDASAVVSFYGSGFPATWTCLSRSSPRSCFTSAAATRSYRGRQWRGWKPPSVITRAPTSTSRRRPGTPSTTGRHPCSTSRNQPHAPGS